MESDVRSTLLEALSEATEKHTMDEVLRDTLVEQLVADDREVFDSIEGKRKRGRPRKETIVNGEECKAPDPSKCWKHGYGKGLLKEQVKTTARNKDRLNPQPTKDLQRQLDLGADLRDIAMDIEDAPDDKNDTADMVRDIDNLRLEAGLKKLNENFQPFADYRNRWKEYEAAKSDAAALVKQAKQLLSKNKYDDVEKMLSSLKEQPQTIKKKYQDILDSYDELCTSLCDIIDSSSARVGIKDAAALEVERQGYGMMDGEDVKAYTKRMKANGRSKEIPETIRQIDAIVAQTERRWRSVAGISREDFDKVKDNFRKTFSNLMKRCSLATNRGIMGVNGVLEDALRSQHDFAKKGKKFDNGNYSHYGIVGGMAEDPRYKFSRKCFGIEHGLKESKYEKYGCLHTKNPREDDNYMGGEYGRNVIRWKPHKTVATMTFTDSLCLARDGLNYVNPCLVTNPSPCCFNPENKDIINTLKQKPVNIGLDSLCTWMGAPYCELQLHGESDYDASAIESISFWSKDDIKNLSKAAVAKIHEYKIPCFIQDRPIELDERGSIRK